MYAGEVQYVISMPVTECTPLPAVAPPYAGILLSMLTPSP